MNCSLHPRSRYLHNNLWPLQQGHAAAWKRWNIFVCSKNGCGTWVSSPSTPVNDAHKLSLLPFSNRLHRNTVPANIHYMQIYKYIYTHYMQILYPQIAMWSDTGMFHSKWNKCRTFLKGSLPTLLRSLNKLKIKKQSVTLRFWQVVFHYSESQNQLQCMDTQEFCCSTYDPCKQA